MTFLELQKLLDDDSKKLSLDELKRVVDDLCSDCLNSANDKMLDSFRMVSDSGKEMAVNQSQYYLGKHNAFQTVTNLLSHLEERSSLCDFDVSKDKLSHVLDIITDGVIDDYTDFLVEHLLADITSCILKKGSIDIADFSVFVLSHYGKSFHDSILKVVKRVHSQNK